MPAVKSALNESYSDIGGLLTHARRFGTEVSSWPVDAEEYGWKLGAPTVPSVIKLSTACYLIIALIFAQHNSVPNIKEHCLPASPNQSWCS